MPSESITESDDGTSLWPPLRSRSQRGRHRRASGGLRLDTSLIVRTSGENRSTSSMRVNTPLLGGFYFSDFVVLMFSVGINLLCTCSVAEMLDLSWFITVYHFTQLVSDMRLRMQAYKLSFFHAYMLCMITLVMRLTPYLPPRVSLTESSIAPFLRWRTGGAISQLVRSYGNVKEDGFRAYWIHGVPSTPNSTAPSPRERIVVLYVHGGGFALGSVALYAEQLLRIMSHAKTFNKNVNVGCVALEYDLVPGARFPSPLVEALRCYAHLLEKERVPASNIVLAGDSAGGNLVMSMLLCLHGQGMARVGGRNWSALPLPARAVLISPWLDTRPRLARAMKSHAPIDYLTPAGLAQFAQLYTRILAHPRRVAGPASRWAQRLARSPSYLYTMVRTWLNQPFFLGTRVVSSADARNNPVPSVDELYDAKHMSHAISHMAIAPVLGHWHDISQRVGLFVLWGEHEVLADDIANWVRLLPRVDTYVEKSGTGVHVWPFLNALLAPVLAERERGLAQIARAILNMPLALPSPEPVSPTALSPRSMPSDLDGPDSNDHAQRAWDADLVRLCVETSH